MCAYATSIRSPCARTLLTTQSQARPGDAGQERTGQPPRRLRPSQAEGKIDDGDAGAKESGREAAAATLARESPPPSQPFSSSSSSSVHVLLERDPLYFYASKALCQPPALLNYCYSLLSILAAAIAIELRRRRRRGNRHAYMTAAREAGEGEGEWKRLWRGDWKWCCCCWWCKSATTRQSSGGAHNGKSDGSGRQAQSERTTSVPATRRRQQRRRQRQRPGLATTVSQTLAKLMRARTLARPRAARQY